MSKAIPFVLLPAALGARVPRWAGAALLGLGVTQVVTDLLFSTRQSDWKRVRREVRVAWELDSP